MLQMRRAGRLRLRGVHPGLPAQQEPGLSGCCPLQQYRPGEYHLGLCMKAVIRSRQWRVVTDQHDLRRAFVQQTQCFHHARLRRAIGGCHAQCIGTHASQNGMLGTNAVMHRQAECRGRHRLPQRLRLQQGKRLFSIAIARGPDHGQVSQCSLRRNGIGGNNGTSGQWAEAPAGDWGDMGKIRADLALWQDGLPCPLPPLDRFLQSGRKRRPRPNRKNAAHENLPPMPMFECHAQ